MKQNGYEWHTPRNWLRLSRELASPLIRSCRWEGIFDPQTGLRLHISEEEAKAYEYRPPDEEEEVLEVGPGFAVLRPVQPIEDMTYGVGNTLNLVRGRRYRVSKEMAQHLVSKGLADVVG